MKIVFLAPFGIRPKGTVIARMLPLALELQRMGDIVTIVAPPYTNLEDSGKTETVGGVKLVNVSLPSCGKAAGAPVLALRMFRTALAEKPDLVHLFKPKGYGGLAAMLLVLCDRLGIRMPTLFLDTDDWEGKGGMNDLQPYSTAEKRLFAFQEQWLSRHAAGVTVASRELERLTLEIGVPAERILYLPNGVDDLPPGDGAKVRERLGIGSDMPVVLLYTRFFEFSQDRLHEVFARIHQRVPTVRFLVVGKGRSGEEELLIGAADRAGYAAALAMAGWVEPGEINDYLAAADVAVYPLDDTLINRAKCPAKLTEILRAGVATVADNVGQAAEYLQHGLSGLLVDPAAPAEMADQVAALLQDRGRRISLGNSGRRYVLATFHWSTAAQDLRVFYGKMVKK